MTFTKSRHLSVTLGLLLHTAVAATLSACSNQSPPETPTEDFRRREPMWISGEIMGVDRIPVDDYNESTVQLTVATEGDPDVHLKLGPGWYMDENGLTFEPQQHIEFQGTPDADGSYVAHSLRRGQQTVELRNPDGSPRWPNKTSPTNASGAPAGNAPAGNAPAGPPAQAAPPPPPPAPGPPPSTSGP